MKKVILSVLVVGALMTTSCKKTKEVSKDVVNKTEKVVEGVVDGHEANMADAAETEAVKKLETALAVARSMGVDIPSFDKPELTQNLADYAVYAKEYLTARGDNAAITKLAPKGAELLKKGQELLKGVDAATVTKFTTVLTAIQSKMAPTK